MDVFIVHFIFVGENFESSRTLERITQILCWNKSCVELEEVISYGIEGYYLENKILVQDIQVDQAKVEFISMLPTRISIKGVQSFLGHVSFYRRFNKNFSKIVHPMCKFL